MKATQDAEAIAKKAEPEAEPEDRFVGECDKCSFRIFDSHIEEGYAMKITAGRVRCADVDACRKEAETRDAAILSSNVRSTRRDA